MPQRYILYITHIFICLVQKYLANGPMTPITPRSSSLALCPGGVQLVGHLPGGFPGAAPLLSSVALRGQAEEQRAEAGGEDRAKHEGYRT